MKETKPDLSQWKHTKLVFNGNEHSVAMIMTVAASGPLIEAAVKDIEFDPDAPTAKIVVHPRNTELGECELIVYKYNNKLVVLAGRNVAIRAKTNNQTTVQARLVSGPALKKARIIKEQPEAVAEVRPSTPVPSGYARQPYGARRWNNERV